MGRRNPALDRAAAAGTRGVGRPPAGRREHRVRFWEAIARGASSVDAATETGRVAEHWRPVVPQGWRDAVSRPRAGVWGYLSFGEREEIAVLLARGCGVREIARSAGSCAVDNLQGAATERCAPHGSA